MAAKKEDGGSIRCSTGRSTCQTEAAQTCVAVDGGSESGGKALIIVESPAKAKTINKYLGKNFHVEASVGHIKNLPKSKIGIDVENGFTPEYETIKGKDDVIDAAEAACRQGHGRLHRD